MTTKTTRSYNWTNTNTHNRKNRKEWKNLSLGQKHNRITKILGKPQSCQHCKTTTATRYDWANIGHEYKEDLKDWIRLCYICHKRMDYGTPEFCPCGNKHFVNGLCTKCFEKTDKRKEWRKKYRQTETQRIHINKYNREYRHAKNIKT